MSKLTKHIKHTAHRAGTARADRKVQRWHKKTKFDTLLSPEFIVHDRTTRQELLAGIIGGVLLLVFLGVLIGVGVPSLSSLVGNHDDTSTTQTAKKKSSAIVAEQTNLQLTLKSWRFSSGGPSFKAYPGFRFVVLHVEMKHKFAVPTWLAPSLQSYVIDQSEQQYQLTPDDEITDPLPAKQYLVGEIAKGGLAYEVPDSATQLQWCYDLGRNTAKSTPLCISLR